MYSASGTSSAGDFPMKVNFIPISVTLCEFTLIVTRYAVLTFVIRGSKPYDSLTVGKFLAHTSHIGDSLFICAACRWVTHQRKSGHASSTVFYYDTRNETLTNKAAQNRQCSIQSVSVEWAVEIWWGNKAFRESQCSDKLDFHTSAWVGKHSSARVSQKI